MLVRKLNRITLNFSKLYQKTTADSKIKELFGEAPETDKDTRMAIEKDMVKKAKQLAEYNKKVKNYHFYEYKRGEDFIENIPINKDASYTIRDQQAEQAEKQRVSIQQLSPILNHEQRAKQLRDKISAYHDKQKKYELEEFQKYLNDYPGTSKGPRPEDDIEAFRAYAFKKIPKILLDEMGHQKFLREEIQRRGGVNTLQQQPYSPPMINAPSTLIDFFGKDRLVYDSPDISKEQAETYAAMLQDDENVSLIDDFKTDVPAIPTTPFFNYQHFARHWLSWSYFRNSYISYNQQKIFRQMQLSMAKLTDIMIKQDGEWMDVPSNIPSLYRYYKCLPKDIQDHPGMKDVYLGLEYSSPDYTNEEKEDAINHTCLYLLPFDQVSTKILKDYTAHSRHFATPYMHEKMLTISPEFTWDLDEFFDELRKQELRGQTSNQNKDLRYAEPPQVHKMWEEGAANLPVDYYENDDGFWDSIISEKLKRYDAHKPMLKTRQHFIH